MSPDKFREEWADGARARAGDLVSLIDALGTAVDAEVIERASLVLLSPEATQVVGRASTLTRRPSATSRRVTLAPTKPVAPVTSTSIAMQLHGQAYSRSVRAKTGRWPTARARAGLGDSGTGNPGAATAADVGPYEHFVLAGRSGFMTHAEATTGLRLFAKEVLPRLRDL